jgi:hypothetical protein
MKQLMRSASLPMRSMIATGVMTFRSFENIPKSLLTKSARYCARVSKDSRKLA